MSQLDDTHRFVVWQRLVIQAQELTLKMWSIDILPTIHIQQLRGGMTFLKLSYDETRSG